jgi:hypothetical protein
MWKEQRGARQPPSEPYTIHPAIRCVYDMGRGARAQYRLLPAPSPAPAMDLPCNRAAMWFRLMRQCRIRERNDAEHAPA